MGLREIYDLPRGSGLAGRMWIAMLLVAALVLTLWLVLPDSPLTLVGTAIAFLLLVGGGVFLALSSRQAREAPGREHMRPPSASRPRE